MGHEITHVLEGTELYNELQSAIVEHAKSKGDYQGRYDRLTELYNDIEGADIDAELTADLVGDYLFTDADFVKRLSTEHRGVFQKLFDEIKHLCKLATASTKEARELEKVKKLFEEAYRTETKNPTNDGGVKYALGDGTVKNASELSRSDLQYLLESAQNGEMSDNSYIPLRRNTPEFFIGVVEEHSKGTIVVENYPMAVTVEHIRQNMDEEDGQSYGKARPHGFSVDDIITISEKMGDPSYIVLQKNGRYAEVVTFYNKRNKQVVVAIDFADSNPAGPKNYKYSQYMNGYGDGYYNIIVTQYEHDNFAKYLNDNEVVYSKKEMNGRYQVGSGRIVTVTHDTPFIEDIISEPSTGVKEEKAPSPVYSISRNEQTTAPAGGYRITGEDIALAPTREDIARMEQGIATAPAVLRNDTGAQDAPDNDTEELGAPTREDILQMEMERELYGDWRMTDPLDRKVEKLYRMMLREQISEEEYNAQLVKADRQYQQRGSRVEEALERIQQAYSKHQAVTADESAAKQEEVEAVIGEKDAYVSKQANALYDEVKNMQKGKRVSSTLSYLLDTLDLSEEHKVE